MNRALRVAWPALTIVVALAASIVASTTASAGSSALQVARAGVLVVLVLAVAAVLGATAAAALEPAAVVRGRVLDLAAAAAAVWTVAAAVTAFLLYLGEAPPLDAPAFGPGLVTFVLDVGIGRGWLVTACLAALLTALLVGVRSRRGVVLLGAATAVAAVPLALQGATSGAPLAVERSMAAAALVQLLAIGTWIGVVALRPARIAPVVAFGALVIAVGATTPALAADGALTPVALTPVALAAVVAVVLAGLAAVAAAVAGVRLRVVQLVLLGVAVGLAAAAWVARTAPDVPDRTSPAEILTGSPLPPVPSIGALATSWQPDAVWLVLATALLVGYLVAVRRSAARWPVGRVVSWIVGVVLLVWLTSGGPAVYQLVLVAPRLVQLVALLLVVPLLLAGGAPGRLLAAALPSVAVPEPRGLLARPVTAGVLAAAVVLLLSGTWLLRWSLEDPIGAEVAVGACLLAGGLLVRALGAPGGYRRSAVVVAVALLLAETAGTAVLGSSGALLAADWYGAMGWGTDALVAQQGAAALVWPVAVAPTVVLLVVALRSPGATVLDAAATATVTG